jgi:hypothetical protein
MEHPRFREAINVLQQYQRAPPPIIRTTLSGVAFLSHPPLAVSTALPPARPAAVQQALQLLSSTEASELERLTSRLEANRRKLTSLKEQLLVFQSKDDPLAEEQGGVVGASGSPPMIPPPSSETFRYRSATRSHSEMLQCVWIMFHAQLQDGVIRSYRDASRLQDAMALLDVPST